MNSEMKKTVGLWQHVIACALGDGVESIKTMARRAVQANFIGFLDIRTTRTDMNGWCKVTTESVLRTNGGETKAGWFSLPISPEIASEFLKAIGETMQIREPSHVESQA